MKQKKLLYTGKAKSVYRTDVKGTLIVEFRDDITAFDGGKKDVAQNKGGYNAGVSAFFFSVPGRKRRKNAFSGDARREEDGRPRTFHDPA